MQSDTRLIQVGRITGVYGIKGWLKIESYTRPPENILEFGNWFVGQDDLCSEYTVSDALCQGRSMRVALENIHDRDTASKLVGNDIHVYRNQLQDLPAGQYYWVDLLGLRVINLQGKELGTLARILETGANDVLEVVGEQRLLIPLVWDSYVRRVDLHAKVIEVDWEWLE